MTYKQIIHIESESLSHLCVPASSISYHYLYSVDQLSPDANSAIGQVPWCSRLKSSRQLTVDKLSLALIPSD